MRAVTAVAVTLVTVTLVLVSSTTYFDTNLTTLHIFSGCELYWLTLLTLPRRINVGMMACKM